MLPAYLYTPLYHHAMLLVVLGCALAFWAGQDNPGNLARFNQVAMIVVGVSVLVFIGSRPVSGVFVDMPGYAWLYERVQQGFDTRFGDWLFDGLVKLCSPFLSIEGFFFVCTFIYVTPLALASWRVHGAWAFPVFLACVTAFSFWSYGVNGMRNGMATSVLILAFAFYDKPVVMFPLMAAACGFHGSVLLPAGAFLVVRYIRWTGIWLAFWVVCVAASLLAGNVGQMLLRHYNPFAWDERAENYILGAEGGGFRFDFLVYSIVPVVITLLMAAPTRARAQRFVRRLRNAPAMRWIGDRSAMTAKRKGLGRGRLAGLHGASPMGSLALAGLGHISGGSRSALGATHSPPRLADLSHRSEAKEEAWRRRVNSLSRRSLGAGGSTQEPSRALSGQPVPDQNDQTVHSAWRSLPWVRMLRSDPFYARLVNTYLFTNAVWVILIQATQSNRFAYLSWFMMPWILLYPFVPGKTVERPRIGFIAAILLAHYMFTYFMWTVVYRMRFG